MCGSSTSAPVAPPANAPAVATAAAAAPIISQTEWACRTCSFLNDRRVPRCDMCHALMPPEERPPDGTYRVPLNGNDREGDELHRRLARHHHELFLLIQQVMLERRFSGLEALAVAGMAAGNTEEGQQGGRGGRGGAGPASATAIAALPQETLGARSLARMSGDENARQCCICIDDFGVGEVVTRLPCFHLYHADCIKNWLNASGSCPQCKNRVV